MNDLIKALTIMLKYCDEDVYSPTYCEHDVIHVTCVNVTKISTEDLKILDDLGFSPDEFGGMESYRFGSS